MVDEVIGIYVAAMDGAEEDERGNLKEEDLKSVRGADFHGQGDVAVHGKGDGVLGGIRSVYRFCSRDDAPNGIEAYQEFSGVRDQRK